VQIIATRYTQSNQFNVILESSTRTEGGLQGLASIYLPSAGGGQVPLSAIATVREDTRPLLINHRDQFPATTVSFNLAPGASLGGAVTAIQAAGAQLDVP